MIENRNQSTDPKHKYRKDRINICGDVLGLMSSITSLLLRSLQVIQFLKELYSQHIQTYGVYELIESHNGWVCHFRCRSFNLWPYIS